MERFPWHPRVRQAAIARALVIAAVTALALAILAAAGMAATNRVSVAPSNTQPPVVSGTPEIGKELTTTNGTWSGSTPLTFSYQWRRCDKTGGSCADISGATDNTYMLKGADGDDTLRASSPPRTRRQRQRDKRPDRGHRRRAGIEQRLPGQQEREDCADRRTLAARAAPDRRLQGAPGRSTGRRKSFSLKVRVGSTCSVDIQGASVYVTAVPYNQFNIPAEELTGNDGTATLIFSRLSGTSRQATSSSSSRSSSARRSRARTSSPASRQAARRDQLLRASARLSRLRYWGCAKAHERSTLEVTAATRRSRSLRGLLVLRGSPTQTRVPSSLIRGARPLRRADRELGANGGERLRGGGDYPTRAFRRPGVDRVALHARRRSMSFAVEGRSSGRRACRRQSSS